MRSDEGARQAGALEQAVVKFLARWGQPLSNDTVAAFADAMLEAYNLGAVEVAGALPHEVRVFAQTDSPSADDVNKVLRQGWSLAQIIPTMVPKLGQRGPKAERAPGFALWVQRIYRPRGTDAGAAST